MVSDAALDAAILRQARGRRVPRSPDPMDSIAPPSYEDASAPPKYEDIVAEGCEMTNQPATNVPAPRQASPPPGSTPDGLVDSAGPDNGNDVDMLIV